MTKILAVESSCDETSVAVVNCADNKFAVLSNVIASQVGEHMKYGGVVPEIASRRHIECIDSVAQRALEEAGATFSDIDAVAVTYTPGLIGALLVGVSYAKSMAFALGKPLVAVNHIEGHICANYIEHPNLQPPFVCLVASGGHSSIILARDYDEYERIARTRDDAAGEAFDKVARALGLGYPGGPNIERAAADGDAGAFELPRVRFADSLDFSFSGVKTAVINILHKRIAACGKAEKTLECGVSAMVTGRTELNSAWREDMAASFQRAVCDVLAENLIRAADKAGVRAVALAGGVAANGALRARVEELAAKRGLELFVPSPVYCTDNAAMIGVRGYYLYKKGEFAGSDLNAKSS